MQGCHDALARDPGNDIVYVSTTPVATPYRQGWLEKPIVDLPEDRAQTKLTWRQLKKNDFSPMFARTLPCFQRVTAARFVQKRRFLRPTLRLQTFEEFAQADVQGCRKSLHGTQTRVGDTALDPVDCSALDTAG